MKFKITRTSGIYDEKPHKNAKLKQVPEWMIRTCTEDYYNKHYGKSEGLWRSKGKNHTIMENGYIKRQVGYKNIWIIEINKLEEIKDFIDKEHIKQRTLSNDTMGNGELVLGHSDRDKIYTLEFYDGYRE